MRPATVAVPAAPLAAALLALAAVAATGFDQRSALPPAAERVFYGFFLDRYPLFAFALVYALARILAVAAGPGPAGPVRRILGALVGLVLVLVLGLYPTFGGMVLRSGFATGGIAFLNQAPMWLAYALGAAAAAASYGAALGLGVLLTNRDPRPRSGWGRALAAGAGRLALRFGALWFALAVLGLARDAGIGPWPRRALTIPEFGISAVLLVLAFLPHSVVVTGLSHTRTSNPLIEPPRSR
jgi:hypothetical protein